MEAIGAKWPKARLLNRTSWTLVDQGIVSLGSFLINLQLARGLAVADYGAFAILLGALLTLQIINSSLFFYPLTVRLVVAREERQAALLTTTLLLVAINSLLLTAFLVAGLSAFGRTDILVASSAYFLFWQMQEATRRGHLACFRFKTATAGDAVTYIGQPLLVAMLAGSGSLTLASGLYAMAAACGLGALIHASQLRLCRPILQHCLGLIEEYWSIGKWFLVNNWVLLFTVQIFPWSLAVAEGTAAAAPFQAVLYAGNLLNPLAVAVSNVMFPTAAQARISNGLLGAWRAARVYIFLGLAPALAYSAIALLRPDVLLRIFYGADSPYLGLTVSLQLFALAWPARYAGELILDFLLCVEAGGLVALANSAGIFAAIIALPFVLPFGLPAIFLALVGVSAVRLAVGYYAVATIIRDDASRPADCPTGVGKGGRWFSQL
jgi:O-antigen/teichoic acid export membrane protein